MLTTKLKVLIVATVAWVTCFIAVALHHFTTPMHPQGFAGLPAPHEYTPAAKDADMYKYVHTHECGESHHEAGFKLDHATGQLVSRAAFNAYYCAEVDDIIFIEEAE